MPEQFGRYELLKRLAGGGMGEVYLARQRGPAGFQKLLVIKMLLPHLCEDEEFLAMFKDEARLCAHLIHPNICQVFEFDQAGGTWYIAMEYLRGEDLRRLWRACEQQERPLPVPLICRIVADAAAGLAFAHSLRDPSGRPYGIVHRDISPQNILVTLEGGVKIIDFGIAKAAGRAQHTRTGALKGKCGYMSPEQADGAPIDGRADIFSLGVVFHELLTGRRLFKAEDDVRTLARVRECRVPRPSEVVPELPSGLDLIVLTALAKDPAARYSTAQEMRLAIEEWLIEGRRSASSAHLAEFLKVIYADRLEREAGEATAELPTPAATRTPAGSSGSGTVQSAIRTETGSRRSTARRATVAATVVAAVAAVSVVAFFSGRAPTTPPAPSTQTAALARTPVEQPAPPPRVMVVLKTDPAGAEISEGSTVIGTSPHVWSATRGEHQLSFQLAGHRGVTQEIVAATDGQEIVVRLPPLRPAHRVVKDPAIKAER
jgi:eukaryotic-like serine/threonine-protein kinase